MYLIVGLGNPGKAYANTKHNLGFLAVEKMQKEWGLPVFKLKKNLEAEVAAGQLDGQKIILAKPQTFVNLAGRSVQKIVRYYRAYPKNLIVIHDDHDLELGQLKISYEASAAGHKGVQSIIDYLKTQKFIRLRLGIKKTTKTKAGEQVLKKISAAESRILDQVFKQGILALKTTISQGLSQAMSKFNKKIT